jgi:hypothetical protein
MYILAKAALTRRRNSEKLNRFSSSEGDFDFL